VIELQTDLRDAICEVFNVAVGKAANSLSIMMKRPVGLNVPSVDILELDQVGNLLDDLTGPNVCGVTQGFDGKFDGNIVLVFPETQSLELVRMFLSEDVPLDALSEMEQEALTEVGNVLLNACLSTIADILGERIKGQVPAFMQGPRNAALLNAGPQDRGKNYGMFVRIGFTVGDDAVTGYVVLILELSSMKHFISMIDKFLAGLET
jgi:chemotaxis protein CheC